MKSSIRGSVDKAIHEIAERQLEEARRCMPALSIYWRTGILPRDHRGRVPKAFRRRR